MLDIEKRSEPISSAELLDLADYADGPLASHLKALAHRQQDFEQAMPMIAARHLLGFFDHLKFYDDQAASHLVNGLLRVAAGQIPTSVEKTAMCIAGLAQVKKGEMSLTAEGTGLIARLWQELPPGPETSADPDSDVGATPEAVETTPFAMLRFGEKCFQIAEGKTEDELVFRLEGESDWRELDTNRVSGWDVVGAEMLTKTINVVDAYTRTHVIRLPAPDVAPNCHVFELEHLRWYLKIDGTTAEFATDPHQSWIAVPQDIKHETIRDLGIAAAQSMIPNFKDLVTTEANSWVRRMAHAAAIMPVS